ncbi:hypothetical protein [Methylobacterium sp. SI9]|uniref:hypothetical protein n=1 Tax=Methylobacterium guangdongense TaxID=3138811 RepID=UPI00313E0C7F
MPVVERFMFQVFRRNNEGDLIGDDPVQMPSPEEAVIQAEALEQRVAGGLVYKWKGDMRTGEQGRLVVLKRFGVLPLPVLEQLYSAATPY